MIKRTIPLLITLAAAFGFAGSAHAADASTDVVPSPCSESTTGTAFTPLNYCYDPHDIAHTIVADYRAQGDDAAAYDACRNLDGRVILNRSTNRVECVGPLTRTSAPIPRRQCFPGVDVFRVWDHLVITIGECITPLAHPDYLILIMSAEGSPAERCDGMGGTYEFVGEPGGFNLNLCHGADY